MFTFDPAAAERNLAMFEVDVAPTQREQLGSSRAGRSGQHEEQMERGVGRSDMREERREFLDPWRFGLAGGSGDAMGAVGGLSQIHPHRIAWASAECNTTCTRLIVPGANGWPHWPPRSRSLA